MLVINTVDKLPVHFVTVSLIKYNWRGLKDDVYFGPLKLVSYKFIFTIDCILLPIAIFII